MKKGRKSSVASIPRGVGEIAKKYHLPSISARSSKIKVKKVITNEGNDRELMISWRKWFDYLKNNEDGKCGDLPYHFVVYLCNCVRTGLNGK